jgi:hypothetical protein
MKRRNFRIRIRLGLALATVVTALGVASSAQAKPIYDTGSSPSGPSAAAVTSGAFDWGNVGIGAGAALGAALAGVGTVRLARGHGRLAGQH